MELVVAGALSFCLDLLLGDPGWIPHPVVWMGRAISGLEERLRRIFPKTARGEWAAGALLAILLPAGTLALTFSVLWLAGQIHPGLRFFLEVFWGWQALAVRGLGKESSRVYRALREGTLEQAQQAVARIVGRDTQRLDRAGVTRAAVETVAENASDGVIAPLIFLALGGAPLGMLYKAVNTMDSMVGYRNDRYRYFGTGAARLDDVCNFLPARLTALLMILLSGVCGLDRRGAWRVFRRDRYCHASPNSAQTESAMAGALGIQLGGDAWYFGQLHKKKTIGDSLRPVEPADIPSAIMLMTVVSDVAVGLAVILLAWIGGLRG